MARTKTSRRSQSANKKLVTPAQKKRIEVQIHRAWVLASDVEQVDSDDAAVQAMSTPTVTLTDLNFRKSTPKLSTSTPVMQRQTDSEESAIAATPTSSRKSLPPTSGSVEASVQKRRKRCENYLFTDEQEANLSEWYQHHPMFYEKGDRDYKNAEKKNSLLEEKGSTMHPPASCKYYSHKCLNINM